MINKIMVYKNCFLSSIQRLIFIDFLNKKKGCPTLKEQPL